MRVELGLVGLKWILCVEPDPEIKISRSHYKFLSKLSEICWGWLNMTDSYSVKRSMARATYGPHIKSRILIIKSCVYTIKFYRNKLNNFFEDDRLGMTGSYCVQTMWQNLRYNFFWKNRFLLRCNNSLTNNLLYYKLKCVSWICVWLWWFRVEWVILICLMRMN